MAELGQKKVRNHELDFWKFVACALVLLVHSTFITKFIPGMEGVSANSYFGISNPGMAPYGVYTLGFFTFTTGYWHMEAFQKYKRANMLRKGHDFEIIYRLSARNYVAYAPICFAASAICFIYGHWELKSDFYTIWNTFVNSIWEFFGINGIGMFESSADPARNGMSMIVQLMTGLEEYDPTQVYSWAHITWYMTCIICFSCVFFALLVFSEKMTMFVVAPLLLATTFVTFYSDLGLQGALPHSFAKLWGPAMLGFAGWYIIQALKKIEWSDKARKIVGFVHMAMAILTFVMIWFGYPGGMINMDVWMAILVSLTLIQKDWFGEGFNKVLSKVPFIMKHLGNFSLGLFALQSVTITLPFRMMLRGEIDALTAYYYCLGLSVVGAFAWCFIDPLVVKPLAKLLNKVMGLNTPFGSMTVLNDIEEKSVAVETK